MKGLSKTRLRNKFTKYWLDYVTGDQEVWITKLELLRGHLRKMGVSIDDVEMITHIMSNLSEEYDNIARKI